ncbi:MAG: CrcB family protein [Balneolaceae bacterium]
MRRELILVGLGGAAGAVLRHLTDLAVLAAAASHEFFTGIILSNMAGCLIIGFFFEGLNRHYQPAGRDMHLFLFVGLIGSYTTYSAYILEGLAMSLISPAYGLVYIVCQAASGILFVWLGIAGSSYYRNR